MRWRFTLIDRYDKKTVIDEPVGWDSFSIRIKRHPQRHGTFRELQGNRFKFFGKAQQLLRAEYKRYGIKGKYSLLIEFKCSGGWDELYTGTISFDSYSFTCAASCFVTAEIEQTGSLVKFINRFDQKVDLSKSVAFDGAELTDYENLSKQILLPSKAIMLRGISKNIASHEYVLSNDSGWIFPSGTGNLQGSISIPFDTTDINTIKDYNPSVVTDFYALTYLSEYVPELIFNNANQDLNCVGSQFNVNLRIKGRWKHLSTTPSGNMSLAFVLRKGPIQFAGGTGNTDIFTQFIIGSLGATVALSTLADITEFDVNYTGTISLDPNEKLWADFFLNFFKATNFDADERIEFDPETFFKVSVISKCDPTYAKVYLINETTSRVIEAITNNELKLYSEYLGRTNSEPYSFNDNGCGSIRGITTGLDIRNAKLADGSDPKMFISMQDIFEAITATDNIGIGIEGTNKIRVENWKWFYKSDIMYSCKNVDLIEETVKAELHWSIFKSGYETWEAENMNGLDEFLTKRQWRTSISQTQNTLEQICKWIASGYAWEVTRRIQQRDQDWRYDNNTFVVCLTNIHRTVCSFSHTGVISVPISLFFKNGHQIKVTGTASNNGTFTITGIANILFGLLVSVAEPVVDEIDVAAEFEDLTEANYEVEIGNIDNPENIIDPDTVYNYRISPVRNAMKWFDRISAAYRNISNADRLIFSAGDGNYIAKGKLKYPNCRKEANEIAENEDISLPKFAVQADGLPINFDDSIKYKYPLGANDFKKISASLYGLIEYSSGCEKGKGWIDELEYFPEQGIAKFNLIPKILSFSVAQFLATEAGEGILTEGGDLIMVE